MALGTTPARLRVSLLRQGLITIAAGAHSWNRRRRAQRKAARKLVDGAKALNATTYAASVLFIAWIAAMGIWWLLAPLLGSTLWRSSEPNSL